MRRQYDLALAGVVIVSEQRVAMRDDLRYVRDHALPPIDLRKFVLHLMELPLALFDKVLEFLRTTETANDAPAVAQLADSLSRLEMSTRGAQVLTWVDPADGLWHAAFADLGDDVVLLCQCCGYAKPNRQGAVEYNGGIPRFHSGREIPSEQPKFLCGRCRRAHNPFSW
mmetsp:Transcript_37008/g.118637  ORF Transcript_37008/g.118637 Transcript_37008/m.118637 type:complete len:169 (+) Transcript_37008:774-1280(+)